MAKHCKIVNHGDSAEVYLYDEIGFSFFGGISAKEFIDDINALDVPVINVRINSPGGDVFDGVAMYNALKRHSARVVVDVDGLAASIASVIAMAGDEVRIADGAMFMIHRAMTGMYGNANEMEKTVDLLRTVDGQMEGIYLKRIDATEEQLTEWLDEETWLTAEESVEYGFADTMGESQAVAAMVNPGRFNKTPSHLVAKSEPVEPTTGPAWRRLAAERKLRLTSRG